MSQLAIVWRKEMYEAWKNRRYIWLPLVFILIGVMEPVSTHFMPQILKMSGGLPPGTVIQIPTPSAASVFAKAEAQYSTLGLLVLVLAFMGSVSNERQHGVLELVMVKPVSYTAYVMAKWLAAGTLTMVALLLGDIASWYYTVQLIGRLALGPVLVSAVVYGLWLMLIVTLSMFFSIVFNSTSANAFISLVVAVILSVVAGVLKWQWSPGALPTHATDLVLQVDAKAGANTFSPSDMTFSIAVTAIIIVLLIVSSIGWFKRRTFA